MGNRIIQESNQKEYLIQKQMVQSMHHLPQFYQKTALFLPQKELMGKVPMVSMQRLTHPIILRLTIMGK